MASFSRQPESSNLDKAEQALTPSSRRAAARQRQLSKLSAKAQPHLDLHLASALGKLQSGGLLAVSETLLWSRLTCAMRTSCPLPVKESCSMFQSDSASAFIQSVACWPRPTALGCMAEVRAIWTTPPLSILMGVLRHVRDTCQAPERMLQCEHNPTRGEHHRQGLQVWASPSSRTNYNINK